MTAEDLRAIIGYIKAHPDVYYTSTAISYENCVQVVMVNRDRCARFHTPEEVRQDIIKHLYGRGRRHHE